VNPGAIVLLEKLRKLNDLKGFESDLLACSVVFQPAALPLETGPFLQ
jgi:hypothetical protein